jgi:hypothetical protein
VKGSGAVFVGGVDVSAGVEEELNGLELAGGVEEGIARTTIGGVVKGLTGAKFVGGANVGAGFEEKADDFEAAAGCSGVKGSVAGIKPVGKFVDEARGGK